MADIGTQRCAAEGCSRRFDRTNKQPPKKYCTDICRARAGDQRRIETLRQRMLDGKLSERDLSALAVLLSSIDRKLAARARKSSAKPVSITASHHKIICFIEEHGGAIGPDVLHIMPSAPVRMRELRALGYLTSRRWGRYASFTLTQKGQELVDQLWADRYRDGGPFEVDAVTGG